jgi:hypothetical protein
LWLKLTAPWAAMRWRFTFTTCSWADALIQTLRGVGYFIPADNALALRHD